MAKKKKNKKETEEMIKIEGEDEVMAADEAQEEAAAPQEPEKDTAGETGETEEAAGAAAEEAEADAAADEAEEAADADDPEAESAEEEKAGEAEESADDEAAGQAEEQSSGKGKQAKGFARKKDKKDEMIEDLQDKLTRRMAEFDNFRKRSEKEKSQMYSMGARDVLEKMLEVMDNFERGFEAVDEEDQDDAFVQGMQMVYKQMQETFEKLGVKPIEAVGKPFDPNFHNAVMHEDNEEAGENEVVEEFQKGYMYHDDVIRHSMVKVAN